MTYERIPISAKRICLAAALIILSGCVSSGSSPTSQEMAAGTMTFQEPNKQKAESITPAIALDELKSRLDCTGSDAMECFYVRQFSEGTFPEILPGRSRTTGRSFVLSQDSGGHPEPRFLTLWLYHDEDKVLIRFFDPNPADANEIADIQEHISCLETGRPLPDNTFGRYLKRVTKNIKLFQARYEEDTLAFKGSETWRTRKVQQEVVYFVREKSDYYYVIFLTIRQDLKTTWGIAQLPKPTLP